MRLTTDKPVAEMGMWELSHNCCYIGPEKNVRYRDYEQDVDARELMAKVMENVWSFGADEISELLADAESFDECLLDCTQFPMESQDGMIGHLYRLIVANAELREALKRYEDIGTVEEFLECKGRERQDGAE